MNHRDHFLDITLPLTGETPVFPGDPPPEFHVSAEDDTTVTVLRFSLHTGTHMDAPLHVIPRGAPVGGVDRKRLIGPCCVVAAGPGPVTAATVRVWPLRARDRVLARSAGDARVCFTVEAITALLALDIRLLGVEGFGPDAMDDPGLPAHRLLLGHDIPILENLNLAGVEPGRYHLTCLGLNCPLSEAVPVRAVLTW